MNVKGAYFSAVAAALALSSAVLFAPVQAESSAAANSQWDGVYTQAQMKRGETLYSQHCLICHGADLMGGEMAPPLVGGQFLANWNELALSDLFERIRVSMPLNAPGALNRQEVADTLSYLLAKGGYPAGQSELPSQTESLTTIKFLAAKP